MKRHLSYIMLASLLAAACSEKEEGFDAYANWTERNMAWYNQILDSANTAINQAKLNDPVNWENTCNWRILRSVKLQPGLNDNPLATVCFRYIKRSTEVDDQPLWDDSVRVNYRGWLMPTFYYANGVTAPVVKVFDQSYYGDYDEATAYPQQMCVKNTVTGFATALEYMHRGDEVMLYIPCTMGYGLLTTNTIPGGSTLQFQLHLVDFFHADKTAPAWK